MRQLHQCFDGGYEIIGDGAAQAAIGEFEDRIHRTVLVGAGFQDVSVNADIAEFIDDHGEPQALRVLHQIADQRRLPRAEKAGDDGDGGLADRRGESVAHADWSSLARAAVAAGAAEWEDESGKGGIRAITPLRKICGRSRHGTIPSSVPA